MKNFFARDVYIRLSDCQPAFVCTVKRSGFLSRFPRLASKATEFALHPVIERDEQKVPLPIKRWLGQIENERHPAGN